VFPTHKVAGGAPMNVAFHANNLGLASQVISAVGQDDLGTALLQFLEQKNISTNLIQISPNYPTSTVQVTLSETGGATYEIVAPVAWDFLQSDLAREKAVAESTLLLYGSLICRKENNKSTLFHLIEKAQKTVFDVNLRPPFYDRNLIESLLQKSDIVKVNDEELDIIISWYGVDENLPDQMAYLMDKFHIETMIMTKGKDGAYCKNGSDFFQQKSFPVQVTDTVGSGDSFLAAFLFKMMNGFDWQQCLEFACATGAFVATQSGGTPMLNEKIILDFIRTNS